VSPFSSLAVIYTGLSLIIFLAVCISLFFTAICNGVDIIRGVRNNSEKFAIDNGGNATFSGTLYPNAVIATYNVTAYSDEKLKKNLEVIPNALEKVQTLTGYTFDRKDIEGRQTGLIAQDVQKILPEAVVEHEGTLSLAYGNLVGLLVEAIKELKQEVEDLKSGTSD